MKSGKLTYTAAALASIISLCFVSCADQSHKKVIHVKRTAGFNPNHGPFDSRGNYIEAWADTPPKRVYVDELPDGSSGPIIADVDPIPTPPVGSLEPSGPPISTYNPTKPKPNVTKPKVTKPKPKTKPIKVKPKRKPAIIHIVKKGDTLYGLARRYKSGVKTIQIANNMKGSTIIRVGQKLKIPRY